MSGLTFQDNFHILAKRGDNTINFQVARQDMGSVTNKQYNGWVSSTGEYIIMERDLTDSNDITNLYFFAKSTDESFQNAWNDRENKVFVEYNLLFA